MKITHYTDIIPKRIDNESASGVLARVLIGKDDGAGNFCMRMFQLEKGGFTPRHSHEWEHEIFVHGGEAEVFAGGKWTPVREGCAVFIPGGDEHQIKNTGGGVLSFICLIPAGYPEL